jgi:hypothetical protein
MAQFFRLPAEQTLPMFEQLELEKELTNIRKGGLPTHRSTKFLEGGETCHWEGPCSYRWDTRRMQKYADGVLIISSQRLIFTSSLRSFEFAPSKIVDVILEANGVQLATSSNTGSGFYFLSDSRLIEAILVGLVRKHKFLQSDEFSSNFTRHIPDLIKRAVWDRDGGRCARCGALEYLEFDHIIPHSRGGANTVNNVQLLCRKCNLHKSDRI